MRFNLDREAKLLRDEKMAARDARIRESLNPRNGYECDVCLRTDNKSDQFWPELKRDDHQRNCQINRLKREGLDNTRLRKLGYIK